MQKDPVNFDETTQKMLSLPQIELLVSHYTGKLMMKQG
jgi:hypothetical protein